jgi:hypothetical protein
MQIWLTLDAFFEIFDVRQFCTACSRLCYPALLMRELCFGLTHGTSLSSQDKMNTLGIGDVEVEMSGVGKPPKIITEVKPK